MPRNHGSMMAKDQQPQGLNLLIHIGFRQNLDLCLRIHPEFNQHLSLLLLNHPGCNHHMDLRIHPWFNQQHLSLRLFNHPVLSQHPGLCPLNHPVFKQLPSPLLLSESIRSMMSRKSSTSKGRRKIRNSITSNFTRRSQQRLRFCFMCKSEKPKFTAMILLTASDALQMKCAMNFG